MKTFKEFLTEGKGKVIKYSSTQINLPPEMSTKIIDWANKNIDSEDIIELEDKMHCTVLYGLHTRNENEVLRIVQGFGPVSIALGTTSSFESETQDVLKLDVNSASIQKLNYKLRSLPFTSDYPTYIPHVTIAYIKSGKVAKYTQKNILGSDGRFSSTTIQFSTPNPNRKIYYIDLN